MTAQSSSFHKRSLWEKYLSQEKLKQRSLTSRVKFLNKKFQLQIPTSMYLVTFLLIAVAISTSVLPKDTSALLLSSDVPVLEDCGGVLETEYATISYKPDTNISQNERCVWVIRSPTAISYTLDVLNFGLQVTPGGTGVTASCLNFNAPTSATHITM